MSTSHKASLLCFFHDKLPSESRQYKNSSAHATTFAPFLETPTPTIALLVSYSHNLEPLSVNIATESPVPITITCPLGSTERDQIAFPTLTSHSTLPRELNILSLQSLPPQTTLFPSFIMAIPYVPSPIFFSQIFFPSLSIR